MCARHAASAADACEQKPHVVSTDLFHGRITVRIKDFTGQVPEGQERQSETKYFDAGHAHGCTWSIQIQGERTRGHRGIGGSVSWSAALPRRPEQLG
jgi:hypothetical protein